MTDTNPMRRHRRIDVDIPVRVSTIDPEIDPDVDCGWQLIYDRLSALGKLENMSRLLPTRDWSTSRDGGSRERIVEELRK